MARKALKELVIGDMEISDLPEVAGIELESFTTPWPETLFYNEIHKQRAIAKTARIGGRVMGYICAEQIIDEGHILDLAVHPGFRRRGIAARLVDEIINCLRNNKCGIIFLETRASNDAATRLYERFEFKVLARRKKYYTSPVEDAVIMALKLDAG